MEKYLLLPVFRDGEENNTCLPRYCLLFSYSTITYIHKEYEKLFINQLLRELGVI